MIFNLKFNLLIVHNHDRMHSTSTTQVLHTATWDYFTSRLPYHFGCSPKAVKEAIMTDINDLVQEISSDGSVGLSFFAIRRLFGILHGCFNILEVCFDIISL